MAEVVPIFPLDVVLLPGAPLPLHIFEPRYRTLLSDVCAPGGSRAFGVVSVKSTEGVADGQHELSPVGTLAEVIEVDPYPDGRSDLLTIGSRRFTLLDMDETSKPYLCATIEWLPEEDGVIGLDQLHAVRVLCNHYSRALARLAGREAPGDELADDPLRLSYQVAARLRLPTAERQHLLEAATAADRLRSSMAVLRRETTLMTRTGTVPVSPHALRSAPTLN
jgi:Lon protease-like protein